MGVEYLRARCLLAPSLFILLVLAYAEKHEVDFNAVPAVYRRQVDPTDAHQNHLSSQQAKGHVHLCVVTFLRQLIKRFSTWKKKKLIRIYSCLFIFILFLSVLFYFMVTVGSFINFNLKIKLVLLKAILRWKDWKKN